MKQFWFVARMSLALTLVVISLLFAAYSLGMVPNSEALAIESRLTLAKTLSVQAASTIQARDPLQYDTILRQLMSDEDDLLSAALRDANGDLVVEVGNHADHWVDPGDRSTATTMWIPVKVNDQPWGRAEFSFRPVPQPWLGGILPGGPGGRLFIFLGGICLFSFAFYLWCVLDRILADYESAIPPRIRQALDTLAEGVLVLDRGKRIAHVNSAFAKLTNRSPNELIGRRIADLGWAKLNSGEDDEEMPWDRALSNGQSQLRVPLIYKGHHDRECLLSVNAAPILADNGKCRGALATFDDMTELERKNTSLQELLTKLKNSRSEIHRQNQELKLLATRDPLTLCLNRRAFFSELNPLYEQAGRNGVPLACLMIDVDRFKQINDVFGHSSGDQVLYQIAELLRAKSRNTDLVCRYGGEEFAVVLPQTDLDGAASIAERIRVALAEKPLAGVPVTASFGVSAIQLGPNGPQGLLDQADKAMYYAKRSGRDRVVRLTEIPASAEFAARDAPANELLPPIARPETAIPYPAVTALISALAYRDTLTAVHSRRVADLCVATARDMISQSDVYLLEVAALMHDIGKLGVPDSILFKPGPLTDDEWKVMRMHDRMGVEIITAAFASESLTRIVANHHAWFGGSPRDSSLPTGTAIPLPARVLAVADAYDAMISDRVYRKGRTRDEAFAELRDCAGTQFDPEMVERLIAVVLSATPTDMDAQQAISKDSALMIGTQIERLAGAIDSRDVPALATMAAQLVSTARASGLHTIVDVAGRLERAAAAGGDWVEIVAITHDLLELCRSTQSIYLHAARSLDHPVSPTPNTPVNDDDDADDANIHYSPPPFFLAETGHHTDRMQVPVGVGEPPTERIALSPDSPLFNPPPKEYVVTLHQ